MTVDHVPTHTAPVNLQALHGPPVQIGHPDAACATPEGRRLVDRSMDNPDPDRNRNLLALCAGCPIRALCLATADTNGRDHGIWGGYAPWEPQRPAVQRRRRMVVNQPRTLTA